MFTRILVPLDGSELAARILPQVVDLAQTHASQVTLLHVYYAGASEPFPDWLEKARGEAEESRDLLLALGVREVKVECVEGYSALEIIGYAEENGMDLIALATHGRGEVAWVLGRVAEKVVSHATVPVLLYRVLGMNLPGSKLYYFPPSLKQPTAIIQIS